MRRPKFYKRNGWYYIFAPAGGVKQGWQSVFRSRRIDGPYEHRIVLAQGNADINGPHQGALVDTPSGESWFIHFQDAEAYGRIVHMQHVRWKDVVRRIPRTNRPSLAVAGEPVGPVGEPSGIRQSPAAGHAPRVEPLDGAESSAAEVSRSRVSEPWSAAQVTVRVTVSSGAQFRFAVGDNGKVREVGRSFQAKPGRWVGAKMGLFAAAPAGAADTGWATFKRFTVSPVR